MGCMCILFCILAGFAFVSVVLGSDLYPPNSLTNPGELYYFGGTLPSERFHQTSTFLHPYVIVYGGEKEGEYLDDVQLYDIRFQTWTNPITKPECCNTEGDIIESIGTPHVATSLRVGFEGGRPAARAEHAAAASDSKLYIFGGRGNFGYMNDMYSFDPHAVLWTSISMTDGAWPARRAGHVMALANNRLYLFGGRSTLSHANASTINMNDAWIFDIGISKWSMVSPVGPAGRQHMGYAVHKNRLWIFGGVDAVSHIAYNDIWALHLDTHSWTQYSANSGAISGFNPPPLHHVHLIPSGDNLFVYGGFSGPGACGGSKCNPQFTTLGQIYKFSISTNAWIAGRLKSGTETVEVEDVREVDWEYARLSRMNAENDSSGSGKLQKLHILESVCYSLERKLLFEFGGVHFNRVMDEGNGERRVENGDVYDSGGDLDEVLWDIHTGEHLREVVDGPIDRIWWYHEGSIDNDEVSYSNAFRMFTIGNDELVALAVETSEQH